MTDGNEKKTHDKLVRDRIPEIVEESGQIPITRGVADEEYVMRLGEKLCEEAAEYRDDPSVEELADVLEVVHAVVANEQFSWECLEDRRRTKREARGGFEDGIVLQSVVSEK